MFLSEIVLPTSLPLYGISNFICYNCKERIKSNIEKDILTILFNNIIKDNINEIKSKINNIINKSNSVDSIKIHLNDINQMLLAINGNIEKRIAPASNKAMSKL